MGIFCMIKKQFKLMSSNRIAIFITICVPIVLTYLFSITDSSKITIYLTDSDKSTASRYLISSLKQNDDVRVVFCGKDELTNKVKDQKIDFGIFIQDGCEKNMILGNSIKNNVQLIQSHESSQSLLVKQYLTVALQNVLSIYSDTNKISKNFDVDMNGILNNLLENQIKPTMSIEDVSLGNGGCNVETVRLIGFLSMFLWFIIVQALRTFIEEKDNKVFYRIFTTPVKPGRYIISKTVAVFLFGMLHAIAIFVGGYMFLNVRAGIIDVCKLAVILIAYLAAIIGVSTLLLQFMKTQQQFTLISSVLIITTGLVGGCFFSVELEPAFMQRISQITPEYWAVSLAERILSSAMKFKDALFPIALMAFVGIAGYIFAAAIIRKKRYYSV